MNDMNFICKTINPDHLSALSRKQLIEMLKTMHKIRLAEQKIGDLVAQKEIICPCHLYIGQECIATGVCACLTKKDYVFSTHRSHGHYLAKGGDLKAMMAELFCRNTGCCRGKGGSMHLAAPQIGLPGSSAIVGGTIPLAVGTALSFRLRQLPGVAVVFFGDGATNEGAFYESLNFASLKNLPVVFVCENNFYSTHMPIAEIQAETQLYRKAFAFNMPGQRIDGNNVGEVVAAAQTAVARARSGKGPSLIECITYRWRGHVGPNWDIEKGLRSQEEVDWWLGHCGIKRLEEFMLETGVLTFEQREEIIQKIESEVDEAIHFARRSAHPDVVELSQFVFKDRGI